MKITQSAVITHANKADFFLTCFHYIQVGNRWKKRTTVRKNMWKRNTLLKTSSIEFQGLVKNLIKKNTDSFKNIFTVHFCVWIKSYLTLKESF